jgi:hypothetical protein
MADDEVLSCSICRNTAEETGEAAAPEWCGCCEADLCEKCWFETHTLVMGTGVSQAD